VGLPHAMRRGIVAAIESVSAISVSAMQSKFKLPMNSIDSVVD
jgi:hypothetical protein